MLSRNMHKVAQTWLQLDDGQAAGSKLRQTSAVKGGLSGNRRLLWRRTIQDEMTSALKSCWEKETLMVTVHQNLNPAISSKATLTNLRICIINGFGVNHGLELHSGLRDKTNKNDVFEELQTCSDWVTFPENPS